MIRCFDLRNHIVRPALTQMGIFSLALEDLILGSAVMRTEAGSLLQFHDGYGIYGMTVLTHDDIWARFLQNNPYLLTKILNCCDIHRKPHARIMTYHLMYATCMQACLFYRMSIPLPETISKQAELLYTTYVSGEEDRKGWIMDYGKAFRAYVKGERDENKTAWGD